jgi:ribosomal protein S18 acetylase RimI-like enzyme
MTDVVLRDARPADLDAVVAVFLRCFRETYAMRLPARVTEAFDDGRARSLWAQAMSRPDRHVVVALAPGSYPPRGQLWSFSNDDNDQSWPLGGTVCGVVGFAADGEKGWVHSLYVDPEAQGHGVGSMLLRYAADRLLEAGCHRGYLWVFAENEPSVRFYKRHGWTPDGATRVEEPFGENEVRLSRVLEGAA